MKSFLTYFDFLGFKNFIMNNETDQIRTRIGHILRDIEFSIAQGKFKRTDRGVIAEIKNSRIHCLNISDTVIFWTNDDSNESFEELLKISYNFNWRVNCYNFPARGAMFFDEIDIIPYYQETEKGGTYNVNTIFGKGLVNAHLKAENLNLAGCVIDNSVLEKVAEFGVDEKFFEQFAIKYDVPYKKGEAANPEYLFKFLDGHSISEEVFQNRAKGIKEAFHNDNKGMNERSQVLLDNTIAFLAIMKE